MSALPEPAAASRAPSTGALGCSTVCVLMGGRSSEREVSLRSGAAVLRALGGVELGARLVGVEVEADGRWRLGSESADPARVLAALPEDALYFLALHGGEGENGAVQGLLEVCGRRHTGSGVAASALCMDKHALRLAAREAGLRVAPGLLAAREEWAERREELLARALALGEHGLFVKPASGGSSVDMALVRARDELARAVERVHAALDAALVEARVPGVEATCAVLGNRGDRLRALTPVEIRPRGAAFFDYREKYDDEGALELCPPEGLGAGTCARLQELARRAHELAGCDGYSRADFIVPGDAERGFGEPVLLEVNTLPGLTARSLSPQAAAAEGMDFASLCLEILRLGAAARRERAR